MFIAENTEWHFFQRRMMDGLWILFQNFRILLLYSSSYFWIIELDWIHHNFIADWLFLN